MGCRGFFRRQRLAFAPVDEIDWIVAEPANYDAYLYTPVVAGMWRQHEVWDGTYSLGDLLDAHEMLMVRNENERRQREQAELNRQLQGR